MSVWLLDDSPLPFLAPSGASQGKRVPTRLVQTKRYGSSARPRCWRGRQRPSTLPTVLANRSRDSHSHDNDGSLLTYKGTFLLGLDRDQRERPLLCGPWIAYTVRAGTAKT